MLLKQINKKLKIKKYKHLRFVIFSIEPSLRLPLSCCPHDVTVQGVGSQELLIAGSITFYLFAFTDFYFKCLCGFVLELFLHLYFSQIPFTGELQVLFDRLFWFKVCSLHSYCGHWVSKIFETVISVSIIPARASFSKPFAYLLSFHVMNKERHTISANLKDTQQTEHHFHGHWDISFLRLLFSQWL